MEDLSLAVSCRLGKLAPAAQRRLDRLLERQTEETLSDTERKELGDLVEKAERLTAANARMLSRARSRRP